MFVSGMMRLYDSETSTTSTTGKKRLELFDRNVGVTVT